MSGLFVCFEGGEGAGKSTQASRLSEALQRRGHDVVVTHEPGATPVGARLRELLLDPIAEIGARTEALLYAADRAEHVEAVIRPALRCGSIVISDRYVDSSLAYQGGGRELSMDDVRRLSEWATGGLPPDLTVLLDLPSTTGLARAGRVTAPDRLEAETAAFHDRVRQQFLELARAGGERYLILDATDDAERLAQQVLDRVLSALPAGAAQ